jgi:DNA polymerase
MDSLSATTIDELEVHMKTCKACRLCNNRTQVVFDKGQRDKPLVMIVGEAPGSDEDNSGIPFVGAAGRKLHNILRFVGLKKDSVYITNAVLCRPPNNRNPNPDELDACRWRLHLQVKLLQPELIILMGKVAVHQMWGAPVKGALRSLFSNSINSHTTTVEDLTIPTVLTYHPSYLLRSGKKGYHEVLPHWKMVKEWIGERTRQLL